MMHKVRGLALLSVLVLAGCDANGPQQVGRLEGNYVDPDHSTDSLVVTSNNWHLAGDGIVFMDCTYTARKVTEKTYALDMTFVNPTDRELVGQKATYLVRTEGEFLFVRLESESDSSERKFKRK